MSGTMSPLTYDNLVNTVLPSYLERGSSEATDPQLVEAYPLFIGLGQKQVIQDLKIQGFIEADSGTLANGTNTVAKPDRWRETVSIWFRDQDSAGAFTVWTPLYDRDYGYCRMYWPDATETGTPRFYADYDGSNILIVPTPDAAYPFEIRSYKIVAELSASNQTNYLTELLPNLLLYAILMQAEPFMKSDERIAVWKGLYDGIRQSLTVEDIEKIVDRTQERRRS